MRVLLPIDEVLFGSDLERIAQDRRPAMRGRAETHHLWEDLHMPVVTVARVVVKGDANRHANLWGEFGPTRMRTAARDAWGSVCQGNLRKSQALAATDAKARTTA